MTKKQKQAKALQELRSREADKFTAGLPPVISSDIWGHSFTDQNGIQVHNGAVYGIDESGDLYDLEPLVSFKPSEY